MRILNSIVILLILVTKIVSTPYKIRKSKRHPIVFVPGNLSSQIEAKVEDVDGYNHFSECDVKDGWFRLWLNVENLASDKLECWKKYFSLHYNETSKRFQIPPGVTIRVPGFGHTKTVEHIDPSFLAWTLGNAGSVYAPFIKELTDWGYVSGESIRSAPYDFRIAPHNLENYFESLRQLVEETYTTNNKKRVMLIGHSQGGLMLMYFLRKQSQEWKDMYIHAFMSVNTPWAGSAIEWRLYTSGYNSGIPLISAHSLRSMQRTHESNAFLLPRAPFHANFDDTFLSTPMKNYTMSDYDQWFEDIGFPIGPELTKRLKQDDYLLEHPNVDMYCWHGSGFSTPDRLVYDDKFPESEPISVHYVDGDLVVSRRSLRACQWFMNNAKYANSLREFKHNRHLKLLSGKSFMVHLKRMLLGNHADSDPNKDYSERHKYRFLMFN